MNKLHVEPIDAGLVSAIGNSVLQDNGVGLVWMSVGNSYFNKESIDNIVSFTGQHFSETKFLVPFEPAIYTYLALGYNQQSATTKARLGSNRLRNHIQRSIANNLKAEIIDRTKQVEISHHYQDMLKQITNLYSHNKEFAYDVHKTTASVIARKIQQNPNIESIKIGSNYLLQELSFVLSSADIFNTDKTAYIYHKRREIFENLVNGAYDGLERKNCGFLLVR